MSAQHPLKSCCIPEHGLLALLVMLGGAAGALARCALNGTIQSMLDGVPAVNGMAFPVGILVINTLGGLLMGLLTGGVLRLLVPAPTTHGQTPPAHTAASRRPARLQALLGTGMLGGFTTFSTFSLDTVNLYLHGGTLPALCNVAANTVAALSAAALGFYLARPATPRTSVAPLLPKNTPAEHQNI